MLKARKRNVIPEAVGYGVQANFERFFEWGMGLRNPGRQLVSIAEENGLEVQRHPIGFLVVYLTARDKGILSVKPGIIVRANIFDGPTEDDIHSHGFDFLSGVVEGELINRRHFPIFGGAERPEPGDGFLGYQTSVDTLGVNHTVEATVPILKPRFEDHELTAGDTYTLKRKNEFHSVESPGGGVTIFCKTPTRWGQDGLALLLRHESLPPPPSTY